MAASGAQDDEHHHTLRSVRTAGRLRVVGLGMSYDGEAQEAPMSRPIVWQLEAGEQVSCVYCSPEKAYARGEAFLCGPDHSPLDGNANYVCKDHLDSDAVIRDV